MDMLSWSDKDMKKDAIGASLDTSLMCAMKTLEATMQMCS